jgi:DNA-binding CsgD family transcriptional regulator
VIVDESEYLAHYGILRKSGRYPWGSGKTQSARNRSFLDTVDELKRQGMTDAQIAESFSTKEHKMTSTQLRALRSIAVNQQKQEQINQAQRLKDRSWSNVAIAERMGLNESTVRSLLAPGRKEKADILQATAEMLRRQVAEKEFIDIGAGVELDLPLGNNPAARIGLSKDKFQTAVAILREEGYEVHTIPVRQIGTGKDTNVKVLAKPGTTWGDVKRNQGKISLIQEKSEDGGRTFQAPRRPTNVSSKRVGIVWDEDGGSQKDGLIELRPGVKDLDLGGARYAQVRIAVDGTHYLKGMAIYNENLPAGMDIRFNTNKPNTRNKLDAMKEMEKHPDGTINLDNPFTAAIKPGGQRGALNIVNEEGDWDKHSRNLPSQMLSKQNPALAKQQLDLTYDRRRREFEEISKLTNPAVKRKLLESFADETDSAAVHLKAAAMPRQASKVLLPVPEVKPTEVYAPTFRNGERVSLVRFPHGGTFEIPELTVNNRNPTAKRLLGNASDAVGINHKVAERLSGADFDGDHVLVIPNNRGSVKSTPPLEGLRGFDPRSAHPPYDGMPTIDGGRYNAKTKRVEYKKGPNNQMQKEMGKVTNLIADMTVKGANADELARAVRHSMVVIDAEKHVLDYRGSAKVNGIPALKERYQGKKTGGASTLITRAGSEQHIPERKARPAAEGGPIDPATGRKVFVPSGRTVRNKKGEVVEKMEVVDRLSIVDDAHTLVSAPTGTRIERIYADHSNRLKALANESRKEWLGTKPIKVSNSAKKVYANEVASLNAHLRRAQKNAPLERQAQVVAKTIVDQKRQANPGMDKDDLKKVRNQALAEARDRVGANKQRIPISDREWEAIQAGAISNDRLEKILSNANLDEVKKLATPKEAKLMTSSKTNRARQMLASGYTQAEVAEALGVSMTTLKESIK